MFALCAAPACGGNRGAAGPGGPDSGVTADAPGGQSNATDANGGAAADIDLFADVDFPDAAAYADVNAPQDFTQPVWLPAPTATIQGDLTDLVGSWVQVNTDGSACTPSHSSSSFNDVACIHFDIKKDSSGSFVGDVYGDVANQDPRSGAPSVAGPFPPATDPTIGYPPTIPPSEYYYARQFVPGVPYTMFDGAFANGSLTFWISGLDLWSNWCALQTSFLWNVAGKQQYRCVAQTADPSTTDLGKLALCTSADDGPTCTTAQGFPESCSCLDDAGNADIALTLCSKTVCECSASQCRADLRSGEITVNLALQSNRLVGTVNLDSLPRGPPPLTFERVTP
jgi:hypothetical protein